MRAERRMLTRSRHGGGDGCSGASLSARKEAGVKQDCREVYDRRAAVQSFSSLV
jgi:hypothetical protein